MSHRNEEQLKEWNQSPVEQVDDCIHHAVYDQVLAHPNKEAVNAWDGVLTYRNFWKLVQRLAQILSEYGIGPEDLVPLCFQKSLWSTVAMLATLEVGAGFCPLDATQPTARLRSLSSKLNAKILLCSADLAGSLSSVTGRVLPVGTATIIPTQDMLQTRTYRATPTNVAYVLWTSGSTGEPKGVVIEHRAYCSAFKAHVPALILESNSRVLQYSSYVFDASIIETLTPLMLGATICIPSENSRMNDLSTAINQLRVNWAELTPSVVNLLSPSTVPGLKTLLLVGEVMSRENISTWSHIKLLNAYGPAECSVAATANPDVGVNREPTQIGRGIGVRCWLTNPDDHNKLVPPGCIGELLIEGPTLARGYLQDPVRSFNAFIENPAWAAPGSGMYSKRRMYRTGDLARYHTSDGTLYFVGRKDAQVKLHGQRIELGEIEHHLGEDANISQSMVILPKTGLCRQRLVAVVSLQAMPKSSPHVSLKILDHSSQEKAQSSIANARARLANLLPAFMLPSIWFAVQDLPLLKSGKLDRKHVLNWAQDMNEETYTQWVQVSKKVEAPANGIEIQLRQIWSDVLNLNVAHVGMKQSFINLGGDSISAMMVQSQCKKQSIGVTVQDILRAKSIRHLAKLAQAISHSDTRTEKIEEDFDLSPIQSLYFDLPNRKGHFNQSFLVQLTKKILPKELHQAIKIIVNRHSMLRARFRLSTFDDEWKQRITTDVTGSYAFRVHDFKPRGDTVLAMSTSQASLDPVYGPVFAVDLFNVAGENQMLFMTGHHLVVDLVSWRIILQDLEDILCGSSSDSEPSLSFQTWCKMQVEHAHRLALNTVLPTVNIPAQSFAYWGMEGKPNLYGDVERKGFELDVPTTTLLSSGCHEALHTEMLDILLAGMMHSFSEAFPDRLPPTIFNEGHGREAWDNSIELSRVVGWFTTMYPIYIPESSDGDFVDTLKRVKDFRRAVPAKGRHYFASRLLTSKGAKRFGSHWPLEITFNYLGRYQQLERENALLLPVEEMAGEARGAGGNADVGQDTPRFGLFEISAVIAAGKLRLSFTFNRNMKHHEKIMAWISTYEQALHTSPQQLTQLQYQPTLSDYPLLSLTYDCLAKLITDTLPQIGITDLSNIEDIYRCSQIQQGLLISRQRDAGFYAVEVTYKVNTKKGVQVDSNRLANAWQQVVNRHSSLRTLFVESLSQDDALYDQVVLKNVQAVVVRLACHLEGDVALAFQHQSSMCHTDQAPAHRFTICETSAGEVFFKLEISHTIIDGASMSTIFRELVLFYEDKSPSETAPLYSNYIAFLQTLPPQAGLGYWRSYLADIEPTSFPILNDSISCERKLHSLHLDWNDLTNLQSFCNLHAVTLANVFHTAWAMTLQCYTGAQDVCFGYLMSARDDSIEGIEELVGYLVNMLVCRVVFDQATPLIAIMQQLQTDLSDGQAHRQTALSEVLHALKLSGVALFNTSLSYRKLPMASERDRHSISLDDFAPYYDPTEYSVSINIEVSEETAAIDLDYWTDCLSDGHAANVASTFRQALKNIVNHAEDSVGDLQTISESDHEQVRAWNSNMPETIKKCVQDVFGEQVACQPEAAAVCAWDASLSYIELDTLAERLAKYLHVLGISRGSYVCLCFEKSASTIVAQLAVLKAGGAFVSLDPMNPIAALKLRIKDTQTKVILTSPCYEAMLAGTDSKVLSIDQQVLKALQPVEQIVRTSVDPASPCCVIYTSGSTGKPKGVVLEHQALVTSANAHGSALGIGPGSRFLQFSSYTFDNSLEEILTTLMHGGTVCVPSDHDRLNDLAGAVSRLEANFMDLTPTVATYLKPSDMPTIKGMALGGEALTKTVLEVWGDEVVLHNLYGPSECSINSTHRTDLHKSSDPSGIGRSVGSVSWVVDRLNHDRLLAIGCEGELLIEGPILARGYLNNPEKTSEVFIEDPAWTRGINSQLSQGRNRRRMYKTGDLVRYNSDGTIAYMGRKDQQVKLHGQRIELGEIEYHVKNQLAPDWHFAVELIEPGSSNKNSKSLAVFICPQPKKSASATMLESDLLPISTILQDTFKDLESSLAKSIPKHMVPTLYIPMVKLPLTSSGKLDRKRLHATAKSMTENQVAMFRLAASRGRKPSTDFEIALASLWESVLNIDAGSLGMDGQFFRMGGDSISAIRLVTAARSKGISLTVAQIFRNATLSEMASNAHTLENSKHEAIQSGPEPFALVPKAPLASQLIDEITRQCRIDEKAIQDIYPCTAMQEGLVASSGRLSGAYVARNVYHLGHVDVDKFKKAWEVIVAEENILRTRVVFTDSLGFVQVVVNEKIAWEDECNPENASKDKGAVPPYNGGKLTRYFIGKQNNNDAIFVWTIHHSLYDGWSIELILKKVHAYYEAIEEPNAAKEPMYPKFIQHLLSVDASEADHFWQSRLEDTTAPQYPLLPKPTHQPRGTGLLSHLVPMLPRAGSGITIPSLIRAAWALTIAAYSNSEDVVFAETVTGRDAPLTGIDEIIGPTFATIPVRVQAKRSLTVAEYLQLFQDQFIEALPYQHIGLQRIKRLNEDTARACDFQNLIAINMESPDASHDFWNLRSSGDVGTEFFTYALTVSFEANRTEVRLSAHYDPEILSEWCLRRLMQYFTCALTRLNSQDPGGATLGDIRALPAEDEVTIEQWNGKAPTAVNSCIHEVVLAKANSLPRSSPAVCGWDAQFTYRDLEQAATILAYRLRYAGISHKEHVPICFEKSALTVAVMLALLKIGAAFVAIDAESPHTRLQGIVVDVDAKYVLCSPQYETLCRSLGPRTIAIDSRSYDTGGVKSDPLNTCSSSSDIAYIVFTSGSTGKPKGTLVSHSAFVSGVFAHGPAMQIQSTSRVFQFASYTFDASMVEIFTTLILGGCVCVPEDHSRLNEPARVVNDMQINWALLTPSFAQLLSSSAVPSLKTLVLGGEAMSQSHLSTWADHTHLVNAYGPSECAVVATVNTHVSPTSSPFNIGRAVGSHSFIADQNDHNASVPIGAIGELLIVGPILASGYLNNPSKTKESFVRKPSWIHRLCNSPKHSDSLVYKTGDLVKYAEDGSLIYIGRKDNQTKLHGQRLELGEVEHHLQQGQEIKHGLAFIPTRGLYEKRLVALISFQESLPSKVSHKDLQIVTRTDAASQLQEIRDYLGGCVPPYMVPSIWVVVQNIPLLPSGKLDRRRTATWIEDLPDALSAEISGTKLEGVETQGTETEMRLVNIWSKVLRMSADQIGTDKSFLYLGGDSISALQVVSQCRAESIGVTAQDILRSQSISDLATRVTLPKTTSYGDEKLGQTFGLSPIQRLFFEMVGNDTNHFNQSIVLSLTQRQDPERISAAIKALVNAHSMLRARFEKTEAGDWVQSVEREGSKSYRIMVHRGTFSTEQIRSSIHTSQKSLDIENGPLFVADLFNCDQSNLQVVSLILHHLVVDVVSWTVILTDLENFLLSNQAITPPQLPFQIWCRLQDEHARSQLSKGIHLDDDIPTADYAYWGMVDKPNPYGAVKVAEIEIDAQTTKNLLGPCNRASKTEFVDLLLSSVFYSFCQAFPDREYPPLIFNEAHGREVWDANLDLSRSVGWFTTISPVFIPPEATKDNDIVNLSRWVKDLRSRKADKGRQYFAHRMLTVDGSRDFASHWPMEIAFNYLGQGKHFEKEGSLLEVLDGMSSQFDIGPTVPRFALFEISASISKERLQISFTYPQEIQRQQNVNLWINELEKCLNQSCERLLDKDFEPTLSNFPLLPLDYNHLGKLQKRLASKGVSLGDLEDVYGCSPMQQGLLLSQIKNTGHYTYHSVFWVQSVNPATLVDTKKLAHSWQIVVQKHPSLRTIFIENLSQEGLMDQAVLKNPLPKIVWIYCDTADAEEHLIKQEPMSIANAQSQHQLTICKTSSGRVLCKLELSHAVCDGTSVPIIFRDLAKNYDAKELRAESAPLYRDYISYIQQSSHQHNLAYWRDYLDGVEPCYLPALVDGIKRNRELCTLELSLENTSQLRTFCAHNSVTASNLLQLVWSLVLRAYTGSPRVCFGYLSSGRDVPVPKIEDAVGLFISMLVCRIDFSNNMLLEKALKQIQCDYTQSMAHQAFSLGEMQHELQLSGKALFNTAFTFQRRQEPQGSGDQQINFDILDSHDPSEYDLTVNVEAWDTGIDVHFNYWTDFMCEQQAKNISDTYGQILSSIVGGEHNDRAIGAIELCSDIHRQRIMDWNRDTLPKVDMCVQDLIYEQSQLLPLSAPAVCSWDLDLTYVKLVSLSKRLGKHLATLGVGPEIYVPICFEKSTWAVVAMLGILQAGGAFVPLEPSHPESRLKYILNNINAKLVLCSAMYRDKFANIPELSTFMLDETILQGQSLPEQAVTEPSPANAAYLIFTSGTTGLPKGTIISHNAFATSAVAHAPAILMRKDARVLQFSNLCFDASVMEILTSLVTGACVCIPSEEERSNDIAGAISRMSVSWTLLTPSVANILRPESVPTIQVLVTGGEAMQARHIAKWTGKTSLVNAYGPSESAVIATASIKIDEKGVLLNEDPTNIGRAVGCRSWIVDPNDHHQLMSVGSVGELVVEGNTVARGYLNNEERTTKAFVPRPVWMNRADSELVSGHTQLIYKTGDLVRYNSDGSIVYVARKDTQIKLNGLRIELGEIEHHVKTKLSENFQTAVELVAPAGQQATLAVFFVSPASDDEHVVQGKDLQANRDPLLLSMSENTMSFWKTLKASLGGALPSYMIPSLFVPLQQMPWTASGKLDRSRMSRILSTLSKEETAPFRLATSSQKQAPATQGEIRLRKLWENVLGLESESVAVEDSFFVLGGDSVQAMRLVAAARAQQMSLSVLDIFRTPTLSEMAKSCSYLEAEDKAVHKAFGLLPRSESLDQVLDEIVAQCRIQKEQLADAYPCSALQEGLITLSIKQPGAYVAHNVFRLPEAVDLSQFKTAWAKAIQDMDILRTRIIHTSMSNFIQIVLREENVEWYSAKSTEEATAASSQLPEYSGSPLMRFTLVNGTEVKDRYFVWSIHHALYDGWSMPMMLQRVESIYFEISIAPPQASYSQFIRYLSQVDAQASEKFWKSSFVGMQCVHFPRIDQSATDDRSSKDTLFHTVRVKKAARTGMTLPTVIKAAWALLLSAHTGTQDVVFGETLTGRNIPIDGILDMLGPTLTTVPTRIKVQAAKTVMDLLESVRHMATEVIPYQHVGLQHIRRLSGETAEACNFHNLLVIQTTEGDNNEGKMWDPQNTGVGSNFFTYPLVVECKADESSIHIDVHYNGKHISKWHTQALLHQFEAILQQLCTVSREHDIKLSDVQVMSGREFKMIQDWNRYQPSPVNHCIHTLFLAQTELTPTAEAVCAWDGSFTYQELRKHANSLSHHLRKLGVASENLVPFCMDKSRWAIVAQMGVLMADGALVPLDPTHPLNRHSEIIKDTKAKIILCSAQYQDRYSSMAEFVVSIDEQAVSTLTADHSPTITFAPRATSKNTAYVIFTSGSTGRPKGVVVEHEAFCTSSKAFCEAMLMDSSSRVFNFASVTFDVGLMENLSPLTMGACVCIPNDETKMLDTASAITGVRATWAFLTPSVANLIEPSRVPCLKVLVCGGEAMSKQNVLKWADSVKLVNGYGPTEAAVISVANANVSRDKDASNIGYATANCHAFISEPGNHNRLAPLGSVGELLLGGPILAREYLHDKDKTAAAFIDSPAWVSQFPTDMNLPRRMYKTGDLVEYNHDGSIRFIGRKDNQIKLHGNRIELGEIEQKLEHCKEVRHAVALLPKTGLCKQRLVAVISLTEISSDSRASAANECVLLQEKAQVAKAQAHLKQVREALFEVLPVYMVPAVWVTLEAIPLLVSGKLDRKHVERWVEEIDETGYRRITAEGSDARETAPMTETVQHLREIWASVFNLPLDEIDPGQSFMSQGGDSLISMTIIARCRKIGILLSLQETLRSKSLFQLATLVDSRGHGSASTKQSKLEEIQDQVFDLSPVQKLYFELAAPSCDHAREGRFNQSQLLRITRSTSTATIKNAIEIIVQQHSIFRARFSKSAANFWQQRIVADASSSYRFREHNYGDTRSIVPVLAQSQTSLDLEHGPLLAVELFNSKKLGQVLSLVAHHLIIDVVSWNIILQQLEDLLTFQVETIDKPLSFQVWCALQKDHATQREASQIKGILPFNVQPADMAFWGMASQSNKYGEVENEGFVLDKASTQMALGTANKALRTQPIELLLTALLYSFKFVFSHRGIPTVFNESHGRDAWDTSVDLTGTTGWFTCIYPMHVAAENEDTGLVGLLKRTKDLRRAIPGNGRDYFAHRYSTPDGRWRFGDHMPMEILLNYTGQAQQVDHGDSLLQAFDPPRSESEQKLTADVGPETTRMALFEISAGVSNGQLRFSFMYSKRMQHQSQIRQWVTQCRDSLKDLVKQLANLSPEPTLSDFPLLPTSYSGLSKRVNETFREIGISKLDDIEDMFLCAPTQEGLLLSQIRNPDQYINFVISEVQLAQEGAPLDVPRLVKAWQKVVDRHQSLRTAFVYSICKGHAFDQVVLKQANGSARVVHCDDYQFERELAKISLREVNSIRRPMLPHQFSICTTTSGHCYIKLELNHAVIDGGSGAIITRDLKLAYENRLDEGPRPLYSDYVRYISSRNVDNADVAYWKKFMSGVERCHLPSLKGVPGSKTLNALYMKFDRFSELQSFCRKNELTLSNVMLAGWGLVLRQYMSRDDVCFGNLTAGRDAPVEGIQDTVGAFINMLVCRVNFSQSSTLKDTFRKVQSDYLDSLPYQHCSLAKLQHDLGLGGEPLFNTAVSIQNQISTRDAEKEGDAIEIEPISDHDPTEYAVTINIRSAPGDEGVRIKHWTSQVSVEEGERLAQVYADVLDSFIEGADHTVEQLDQAKKEVQKPELRTSVKNECPQKVVTNEQGLDRKLTTEKRAIDNKPHVEGQKYRTKEVGTTLTTSPAHEKQPDPSASAPLMYRNIVKECIHEVVEQMLKSGELMSHINDDQLTDLVQGKFDHHRSQSRELKQAPKDTKSLARPKLRRNASSTGGDTSEVFRDVPSSPRPKLMRSSSSRGPGLSDVGENVVSLARPKMRRNPSSRGPEPSEVIARTLRSLWSPLVEVPEDKILSDDSFFLLGGDSILAMELARSARDVGLTLTVADVFGAPVFAEMVQVIANSADKRIIDAKRIGRTSIANISAFAPATDHGEPGRFSLFKAANTETFIQDYICPKIGVFRGGILDVLPVTDFQALAVTGTLVDTRWMLNFITFDGQGFLDINRLRKSAFKLVQLFDILRTVFVPCGDRFLQVVLRTVRPTVDVYETEEGLDEFSRQLKDRSQSNPPRLGESYVQFIVIKKSGSRKHRIILRLSHAQYDGICLPKILEAFQAGYEGKALLPPPPFSNYVAQATGIASRDHYDYWKALLQGSSMTSIVHREQPSYGASDLNMITLKRSVKLQTPTSKNITQASILKAAWILVLSQLSGLSDVVFGNLISGRNATVEGVESIVGPCLNIIPVRIRLEPKWTGLDLLRKIQNQQVASMPFESLGFREIVQHCTDWPEWTYFSSIVQHQNIAQDTPFKLDKVKYKIGFLGAPDTLADLTIVSTPKDNDNVEICLGYSDDGTISQTFAEKALDMMTFFAEGLASSPSAQIPSQSGVCDAALLPQIREDTQSPAGPHIADMLRGLKKREVFDMADMLTRAWRMILPSGKQDSSIVNLDSSFHDLGGDLISLASLAAFLEGEGYDVTLEDLMKRPTLGEQIALLSARAASSEGPSSSSTPPPGSISDVRGSRDDAGGPQQRVMEPVRTKSGVWAKSVSLAKKMKARRAR